MKIVFMGTADFAVPSLDALYKHPDYDVKAVVTAPDRMGGRGMKQVMESPIKTYAVQNQIPVFQPEKLKDPNFVEALEAIGADLFVVVAFRMLPKIVWSIPSKGTINLHGSLLPKYRGAAPINWAIIEGESRTGVTTFFINESIDTGNTLLQAEVSILPNDNFQTLHDRMMVVGAKLLLNTIDAIHLNEISPKPQDETEASHAPKIFKPTCKINFEKTTLEINNFIRGLSPTPGAWMLYQEQEVKILEAIPLLSQNETWITIETGNIFIQDKKLWLRCQDGVLQILAAQFAGKKRMSDVEIINGFRNQMKVI